jgi:uncharacterized protein (DUF1778 family)
MAATIKEENLHIRASREQKAALTEAARLKDQKVSQFVLNTALAAAREVLAEQRTLLLSPEAFDAFVRRLDEAPREVPALKAERAKMTPFRD